ncbi:MAG: mandelate racemase/muconate lactonizing enzyme family protein, partial [Pyrinomonadaceae bacterium]|nr:mandelate racemase/muconate lactonizing enzyme family protein [Pyrinomonadaceae bacterium]
MTQTIDRRRFCKLSLGAGLLATAANPSSAPILAQNNSTSNATSSFGLHKASASPIKIRSIEVLRYGQDHFIRTTSTDGAIGICVTNGREYLFPLLKELVIPYFIGKDARDLEMLVDGVYRVNSNYKLAGLAFWNCVGWVDISLMDMLGHVANKSIGELLGGVKRREIPVYISSTRRDTTPEEEVDIVGKRMAETGSKAVKMKVGGRMSRNEDAAPGRSERLVALARKTFGDRVTIYMDANGSYDVPRGIEIGKMLEAHGVAIYEEPCPFDEYENTKQVTDALKITVAGGEQDTSLARFKWITSNHALDVVQPDINYHGGLIRTAQVAQMAATANLGIAPHNPKTGAREAHLLQFASWAP